MAPLVPVVRCSRWGDEEGEGGWERYPPPLSGTLFVCETTGDRGTTPSCEARPVGLSDVVPLCDTSPDPTVPHQTTDFSST